MTDTDLNEEKKAADDETQAHEVLKLSRPPIVSLEPSALANITQLNLPECELSSLPECMPKVLPNLSILFCPKNKFTELPAVIGSFPKLQMVGFKCNNLVRIHPDALQPQLRWLILTDNAIESIPKTIGRCKTLQKLMLSGNKLKEVPSEISNCTNLELVRLASNQIQKPPMELLQLPNLSWVALSANPFLDNVYNNVSTDGQEMAILKDTNLEDVEHGEVLGTGASGITKQVTWNGTAVAVKHYYSSMTSDGDPAEERQISLVASSLGSSSLIQILGQTSKGSLVMELLQHYAALADPPSFDSCSRDVYGDDVTITEKEASSMVQDLLTVLIGLHAKGICHGDFYGHNILVYQDDKSKVKLSDFGAAWFYHRTADYGPLVEKIEMRAFGHFVEEIYALLGKTSTTTDTETAPQPIELLQKRLKNLAEKCRDESSFLKLDQIWSHSESIKEQEDKRQKIS